MLLPLLLNNMMSVAGDQPPTPVVVAGGSSTASGLTGGGITGIKWTGKDSEWETAILDNDEEILDIVNLLIQCRLL